MKLLVAIFVLQFVCVAYSKSGKEHLNLEGVWVYSKEYVTESIEARKVEVDEFRNRILKERSDLEEKMDSYGAMEMDSHEKNLRGVRITLQRLMGGNYLVSVKHGDRETIHRRKYRVRVDELGNLELKPMRGIGVTKSISLFYEGGTLYFDWGNRIPLE